MAIGNEPRSFQEVTKRLNEIVDEVRDKDVPLEKSLDLYEEAIRLGNAALALVNKPDYSPEETAALAEAGRLAAEGEGPQSADAADGKEASTEDKKDAGDIASEAEPAEEA